MISEASTMSTTSGSDRPSTGSSRMDHGTVVRFGGARSMSASSATPLCEPSSPVVTTTVLVPSLRASQSTLLLVAQAVLVTLAAEREVLLAEKIRSMVPSMV